MLLSHSCLLPLLIAPALCFDFASVTRGGTSESQRYLSAVDDELSSFRWHIKVLIETLYYEP